MAGYEERKIMLLLFCKEFCFVKKPFEYPKVKERFCM